MQYAQSSGPAATPRRSLFGPPALQRPAPSRVEAAVIRSFRPARLGTCFDVDLTLWGSVKLRVVVAGNRVSGAFLRGESAVEILDPVLNAEATRAAIEAAQRADLAGSDR